MVNAQRKEEWRVARRSGMRREKAIADTPFGLNIVRVIGIVAKLLP